MNEQQSLQTKSFDNQYFAELFAQQLPVSLALRQSNVQQRIEKLKKFQKELLKRRSQFYNAFQSDFHKPNIEVELTELLTVIDEIRHAIQHLNEWMAPVKVATTISTLGSSSHVQYQPKGRCLILGPWNYPLNTLLCPLVSAVAAGNTVIIKPSEFVPAVNKVMIDLIEAVFNPNEVAVVTGDQHVATTLLALPFNHIFFTGSPTIGKVVMRAAAENLSSITLELGGKSPVIIDESANISDAASTIWWGKLINAGQSCIAPDYCFVHKNVYSAFIEKSKEIITKRFGEQPESRRTSQDLARIISERHFNRIEDLINDAVDKGAKTVIGGTGDRAEHFIDPTILTDLPADATILKEEIFGPVLPVLVYEHIDEVIHYINQRDKPLAMYVWSRQQSQIEHILLNTSSGSVCVNDCMTQYAQNNLPFGGVNNSGLGNSHGFFGFKAFSHERAVLTGQIQLKRPFVVPPYNFVKLKAAQLLSTSLAKTS